VGLITFSLRVFPNVSAPVTAISAPFATAEVKKLHPDDRVARGSANISSVPCCFGGGVYDEPNPAYFPPWLGLPKQ
jgi:hypothetical protein